MRSLALSEQFKITIAAWSSFFELAGSEERRLALTSIYDHLQPRGVLIIDCSFYDIADVGWGRTIPQAQQTGAKEYVNNSYDVKCVETRTFDRSTHRLDITVTVDGSHEGRPVHKTCPCTLYYATPESMRAELFAAGFSHVETFGYYDRSKLYDASHAADGRQIHLARKA